MFVVHRLLSCISAVCRGVCCVELVFTTDHLFSPLTMVMTIDQRQRTAKGGVCRVVWSGCNHDFRAEIGLAVAV